MPSREETITLMGQESNGLVDYLKTLPNDAWVRPSACELWTVADVVGHLVYVMEMVTGGVSRGIRGDITPVEGWPSPGGDEAARHQFLANGALERSKRLGDQLLPTYEQLVHQAIDLAASLGPHDWDKLCYRPIGIRPVSDLLRTVITETAMHSWDIRSSLESSALLSTASLPVLMDGMPRLRQFKPGPKLSTPLRYRFEVSGTVPFQGDIVVEGDTARSETAGTTSPNMIFCCDTDTFVLLMWGRLSYMASVAQGLLVANGEPDLVEQFERRFGT